MPGIPPIDSSRRLPKNPTLEKPTLRRNPTLEKPKLAKPTLEEPKLAKPTLEKPKLRNTRPEERTETTIKINPLPEDLSLEKHIEQIKDISEKEGSLSEVLGELLKIYIKRFPEVDYFVLKEAIRLSRLKRHDQALKVIGSLPTESLTPALYRCRAISYHNQDNLPQALREIQSAIKIEPGNLQFLVLQAQIQREQGDSIEAGRTIDQVISLAEPPGGEDPALEAYLSREIFCGLQQNPTYPITSTSSLQEQKGGSEASISWALAYLEKMILSPPPDGKAKLPELRYRRAYILSMLGNYGESLKELTQLQNSAEHYTPKLYSLMAYCQYMIGEISKALKNIDFSILSNGPKLLLARDYHLKALIQLQLGKEEEARESMEEATELNPHIPRVL